MKPRFAMFLIRLAVLCLALLSTATPSDAQQETTAEQVELTSGMMEGFLASYPELQALKAEFASEYGELAADPDNPDAAVLAYGRYTEARERMEAIIETHDLESLEQWGRIGYTIVLAYSFSERGEDAASMGEEMARARSEIEDDPNIPEEQKKQMLAMLDELTAQFDRIRPSDSNMRLVERYAARIEEVVDPGGDRPATQD